MTTTVITNEQHAPASYESELRERERKLAKRCERIGVPAPVVEITGHYLRKTKDEHGRERVTPMMTYVVRGERPRLAGGWQVVASVEHYDTGNIVSVSPYFRDSAPTDLLHAPATCDHCGHNRARKMTVVVRDEAGSQSRVGLSCLRDFTGHDLPAVWELFSDDLAFDDERPFGGRLRFSVSEVVATAFAVIARFGWASASAAEEGRTTTKERVSRSLSPSPTDDRSDLAFPTSADYERAALAIAWICATTDTEGYLANLRSAVLAEATDSALGLIVSLARSYERSIERAERDAERKREREAEVRVPCLTGRVIIVGKVVSTDVKDTPYGSRCVMTVRDDRGFVVWGTEPSKILLPNGQPCAFLSIGDRIEFTATVERSDRDECFGFFTRPTKAKVVALAE